jgi:glutathione S-transferase
MDKRTLWGIGTSRTMRAHWAMIELGLKYETEYIQTRTPATESAQYRSLNPSGKIPTLVDGNIVVSESAAIVTYLAETYSKRNDPLIPLQSIERASYFEWLSFITMELDATSLYVLRRHEGLPDVYGAAPDACLAARQYFSRMIDAAATKIEDGRPYLLGEVFSGVDILMMTTIDWASAYSCVCPSVFQDYQSHIRLRPSYRLTIEKNSIPTKTRNSDL